MSATRARLAALLLVLAHLALGLSFAQHNSPVWDEVPTFAQGLYLARTGRWDIPGAINHPPLSFYLQSLPLWPLGLEEGDAWTRRTPPDNPQMRLFWRGRYDVARGQSLLYGNAARYPEDRLLRLTRLPTLLLSCAGALILWQWARRLHGEWGGLLSLALWVTSPSIIAHGSLATTDAMFTAFALASMWAYALAWERPTLARGAIAGLLFGCACLTRYTALLLLPPMALLALLEVVRVAPALRIERLRAAAVLLSTIAVVAAAILLIGYQGQIASFIDGVRYQAINVKAGQTAMAAGMLSRHGWWWYYPFVLAVKSPLGLLVLALLGAAVWLRREGLSQRLLFASLPFLFVLAFFLFKRLAVGVRYVLPVYPVLVLAAGALAAHPWRRRRLAATLVAAALAFDGVELARSHPRELSYFNAAAGGERRGWRLLSDSSVDWGQDLKALRAWMAARGVTRISLGYFGTGDPGYYGIAYDALPSFYLRNTSSEPRPWPPTGLVAVSATCYWGLCESGPEWGGRNPYEFLHRLQPIDRVGGSILVFDLR